MRKDGVGHACARATPLEQWRDQSPSTEWDWGFGKMALLGKLFASLPKRAYALCLEARNVGNGLFVRLAPGGDIAKIRNAGDKATVALAVDHRPVPDAIHVSSS